MLSSNGELVRGRCRSTNLCGYCAKLAAVENAELLALDALVGDAPAVWACLTTRTATLDTRRFYKSREVVVRALRRRWPSCEYAALVEFTTGYGSHSGGRRRPHWNLLLKGVPADDVEEAAAVIRSVWCAREDARPEAQHVGPVSEFGGLMRYIALHFQKESQQPPDGWRGHRFLKSRGYLAQTTPEARQAARESLRHKREVWRAIRRGLEGQAAEEAAQRAIARAEATTWRMVDVTQLLTTATRRQDEREGDEVDVLDEHDALHVVDDVNDVDALHVVDVVDDVDVGVVAGDPLAAVLSGGGRYSGACHIRHDARGDPAGGKGPEEVLQTRIGALAGAHATSSADYASRHSG